MKIFANQFLGLKPHIAVFSSNKIGNFVITTPLLRGLKEKYPNCTLDFFGSEITKDFEINIPYVDWRFSLYTEDYYFLENFSRAVAERRKKAGTYDLAINCDEFSELNLVAITAIRPTYVAGGALSQNFGRKLKLDLDPVQKILKDFNWNSLAFLQRHKDILKSNYISEIFCRIAYIETNYFKLEVPSKPPQFIVPDVLVSMTATRSAKMWSAKYWKQVIDWCNSQNLTVGLIGSKPNIQKDRYCSGNTEEYVLKNTSIVDLRGKTSLTELAGALSQTKVCITIDSGALHIATAVGCQTIAIFGNNFDGYGASPLNLWAPRQPHVKIAFSCFKCDACQKNRFKNKSCLIDDHPCMTYLPPEIVIDSIKETLEKKLYPIKVTE